MSTSSLRHLPTARYRSSHDGRVGDAVLQATLDELADRGYAAASLRTISTRAEVPMETVFSRWRSKHHLVVEAIHRLADEQPVPETGDVRTDLLAIIEALIALLTHPGASEVLGAAMSTDATPDDDAFGVDVLGERRAVVRRVVERGQRREQFPSGVHSGVVADALVGAVLYRVLVSGEPLGRATAVRLVEVVVPAATG